MLTKLTVLGLLMIPVCAVAVVGLVLGWFFHKDWGYYVFGAALFCLSVLCMKLNRVMPFYSYPVGLCAAVSLFAGPLACLFPGIKRRYCARYDRLSLRQRGIDSIGRSVKNREGGEG